MPEQDPQVGQADSSMSRSSSSVTLGSAEATIGSIRSSLRAPVPGRSAAAPTALPASIGPPDTNTVGMFSRIAAMSMPGVILSQLDTQIIASAQCALTMYSTESAISSRLGSEYSMPPWPIAIPSSTAIVLNSRGTAPAALTAAATTWPTWRRCTWPGTNSVKLLATAMIGLPRSSRATPVARSSARAPAMFRPWVTVRDLSGGMGISWICAKNRCGKTYCTSGSGRRGGDIGQRPRVGRGPHVGDDDLVVVAHQVAAGRRRAGGLLDQHRPGDRTEHPLGLAAHLEVAERDRVR